MKKDSFSFYIFPEIRFLIFITAGCYAVLLLGVGLLPNPNADYLKKSVTFFLLLRVCLFFFSIHTRSQRCIQGLEARHHEREPRHFAKKHPTKVPEPSIHLQEQSPVAIMKSFPPLISIEVNRD
jgi:hypothetical protein